MLQGLSKYRVVYSHLWKTYGSSWQVRVSFVLQLISQICKLVAIPVAMSMIIAELSARDFDGAQRGVALFVGSSLAIGVLAPLTKYIGMLGENKIYSRSTAIYFSRLVQADLDYFYSNLAGYLTTATRQYVDSCVQLVRAVRDRYIDTLLSIIFPIIVIIWVDWVLGLVTFCLSMVQALYLLWASNAIAPLRTHAREIYKRNSGHVADVIANILAVRSTAQENTYAKHIEQDAVEESKAFTRRYTLQAKLVGVREVITISFFLVLLWLTVERMSSGHIAIAAAVLVITYTTTILAGIYALSNSLDEHDDMIDKIMPAFEILERVNAVNDPLKPRQLSVVRGDIRLDHVSFWYDEDQPVLQDFSLHIPAGQKVGIVGLSGAGKSTLTKLLLRFNDVKEGRILIDGIDLRNVKQANLRAHIAYVPQEPLLFHATIKQNVLIGRPSAADDAVHDALRMAHATAFIARLPQGVESTVGERGVKLSGGQKQRVAIARAVLRQAPIMILDEATSALDSESEQIIKDSFAEILKGKTSIVIAHRLSTLSEMDRIIVIDKGRCIEDGSHQTLLARQGVYARLWQRQQKRLEE